MPLTNRKNISTLTDALLRKYPNKIFVETGTYEGYGVEAALDAGFEEVRTIEAAPYLYSLVRSIFNDYIEVNRKIKLYFGDSGQYLGNMLYGITEPVTFWLDSHSHNNAPLFQELEHIRLHPVKNHTILIDDRRLWLNDYGIHEDEIKEAILKINPSYTFVYEDSKYFKEDILAAKVPD